MSPKLRNGLVFKDQNQSTKEKTCCKDKAFVKTPIRFEILSHRSFQIGTRSCKCLKETPCTPSLVNIRASESVGDVVLPAGSQRFLKKIIYFKEIVSGL